MKLSELIKGMTVTKLYQAEYGQPALMRNSDIKSVQYDSRKIQPGDCFVAIKGTKVDGHIYVQDAITKGAKVIVVQDDNVLPDSLCMHSSVIKIVVPDTRKALAILSSNFYGNPSDTLKMIGVTGTNGKTTSTHLIKSILEAAGEKVGLVGTIEYKIGKEKLPAAHTTPESLELNALLRSMLDKGCTYAVMEVSSHALSQSRVGGIDYDIAVFTNLTQDHLDYHGTMENYFEAKKILFTQIKPTGYAIINNDDHYGMMLHDFVKCKTISYAISSAADFRVKNLKYDFRGTTLTIESKNSEISFSTNLLGKFNIYNILAAFSSAVALGIPNEKIIEGIRNVKSVRGRFERIESPFGWTAIIDYAHTPDALENCLRTIHEIMPLQNRGRIITVFGAGGDRDKTKRPLMGQIAGDYSDIVIVTSDNPRSEDPEKIIDEIISGITRRASVLREVDRKLAIKRAIKCAQRGDVILIAGKGHEDYQIIGQTKMHFSDFEVVESLINEANKE